MSTSTSLTGAASTATATTTAAGRMATSIETPNLLLRPARLSDATALFPIFSDPVVMQYWSEPPHPNIERTHQWVRGMVESCQNGITDFIISLKPQKEPSNALKVDVSTSPHTNVNGDSGNDTNCESSDHNIDTVAIGKIGIYAPFPSNEIGFLLSRPQWGKGLGYEALRCTLDYLFDLRSRSTSNSGQNQQNIDDEQEEEVKTEVKTAETFTTLTVLERRSEWRYASITADVDPRNAACIAVLRKAGFRENGLLERTWYVDGVWVDSIFMKLERINWIQRQQQERQ